MSPSIRPASPEDATAIVALLIQDADERSALDARLWRPAGEGPIRLARSVEAALGRRDASPREIWIVAEHDGALVGVVHAMIVPVPPIYASAASTPGLLLDDCFTSALAPDGTAEALLLAAESALNAAGATTLVASCPAGGALRPLYERHGYEPVTLYMAKHGFDADPLPSRTRQANADDVPAIVALSAEHRRTLAALNSRFWHIHREADARFDAWMRRSLTFRDRDMIVAAPAGRVRGYVIAQPASPLLVPIVHDVAAIGVVDDFYDEDFADASTLSDGGASREALIAAAESAFARRGIGSAIVVCPAVWKSKVSLLERTGYRTAKLWMMKR